MALKQILVTLEPGPALERRLLRAADLALAHEAHLIGLSVLEPLNLAGYFAPGLQAVVEVEERHQQAAAAAARKIELEFQSVCSRLGISSEWRLAEGDPGEIATQHARYADLTITGQVNPESPPPGGGAALPERLALTSGRPVLVVPYVGRYEAIGSHVLVAWNRTREAVRAVHDALPILQKARRVTVLSINPEQSDPRPNPPGSDMGVHLARHGITVETSYTVAKDIAVGSAILSRAADFSADLIVMGCYGHSRFRELVMGGASREILRHMTVPVLMSH
jgi:nucleotide-binding universal stress UspA family protein